MIIWQKLILNFGITMKKLLIAILTALFLLSSCNINMEENKNESVPEEKQEGNTNESTPEDKQEEVIDNSITKTVYFWGGPFKISKDLYSIIIKYYTADGWIEHEYTQNFDEKHYFKYDENGTLLSVDGITAIPNQLQFSVYSKNINGTLTEALLHNSASDMDEESIFNCKTRAMKLDLRQIYIDYELDSQGASCPVLLAVLMPYPYDE